MVPLMNGIVKMGIWGRRGHGDTARKNISIARSPLFAFIAKHALLACRKTATKVQKGSRKPIRSRSFREHFQINLIDFRKLCKRDPFGVLMRWILTVKDHATGFVYLCALPRKLPSLVAYPLQEIFGVMGYPLILHTNNGKEFIGKSILNSFVT